LSVVRSSSRPSKPGGLYPALERRLGAVRLVENRRQRDRDERQVTLDLRRGRTERAVVRLQRSGRLTTAADPAVLLDQMVEDWTAAKASGVDAVMIALTHDAVAELNQRARAHLAATGRLGETVVNATDSAVVIDRAGDEIHLPATYLAAGHLDHGYALTVHKAQGATYDIALLYGDEHLYAEAGYTALTRGRDQNRVYMLADETADPQALVRSLARQAAEPAAIDLLA
jgi:hypothetical protein